jgi:hypothetical membrane protein
MDENDARPTTVVPVVQNTLGESDFRNSSMLAKHPESRRGSAAAVAWLSAGLTYLILEAVAAAAFRPPYSYSHNLISDLGVPAHSHLAWMMNTAFCVQGTLFLAGAVLAAPRTARLFVTLAAANAVGNVLIAVFHSGTATHALGATLAIVGGNAAILAAPVGGHRKVSIGLGVFGLVSFVLFVAELKTSSGLPRGLTERCSVYSITGWQLLAAAWLLGRRPTRLIGAGL